MVGNHYFKNQHKILPVSETDLFCNFTRTHSKGRRTLSDTGNVSTISSHWIRWGLIRIAHAQWSFLPRCLRRIDKDGSYARARVSYDIVVIIKRISSHAGWLLVLFHTMFVYWCPLPI